MKSAEVLKTVLKVLGLGVLALVACVVFFIYAPQIFWGNSQVTATSQERGGLSVRLTHPRVVKGRGDRMTMTVVNHTSGPVTLTEPFSCFSTDYTPKFYDQQGKLHRADSTVTCLTVALPPITLPANGSETAQVSLNVGGVPPGKYKVVYDFSLIRRNSDPDAQNVAFTQVRLPQTTEMQVVPWWRLF
ncbi:hypothetical protein [Deinococcus sp. Marseille-Q6407]|uniref:hypothetical protein n=1 Tax=Deinococcus sp. Marseille-Q6407 TaxID=2969223 RepID=UPI0021BF0E1F|nr:hypothetical protein [Deinococcus sp. Marseille-Q6407]